MSKTKESAISTLSASEFFKRLDLSKLDPNTANYIRQEILSFQNINMLDGTPEFDAVREMVEENYPQALGIIPVPEKDIEKKTQPKEITGKVNKKEQQRLEKEEKEAAKKKHKEEIEEIEGLIELMEDTVKGNPNDTDSKDYLELLQDTLKELKKKKFEDGGGIGEHNDEVVKLEYIGELIEKGNTTGYDPYWKLSIEFDGEIDDDDRKHIGKLVSNGYTSGEIISGEESKRGWWSIDIGESMAKGGEIPDNDPELKKLLEKIEDSSLHSSDGNKIVWHILSSESPKYDSLKQSFQSFDFEIKKSGKLSKKWNATLFVDHIPVFQQEVDSKLGAEVLIRKIKKEVAKKILSGEKYDFIKFQEGGVVGNDVLPPAGKYSEYLQLASSKFGITIDEARSKYGQYTIGQWEELLGGGGVEDIISNEVYLELEKKDDWEVIKEEKYKDKDVYLTLSKSGDYYRISVKSNGKIMPKMSTYFTKKQSAENSFNKTIKSSFENGGGVGEESNPELEGKFVYKFHEERGELSAYVENMATGEEVWSFKYPDYSLPEEEREFQSTPVSDGFMRHWEDINGLENYLKDLSVLPDGSELMSEEKANNLGYYKDGGGLKKWYAKGGGIDNPTIKKIHNAIEEKRPKNYSELVDIVNGLILPSYAWNANNVYFMGAYQGIRLLIHDSKEKEYQLPSKTEVYGIIEHEGLPSINVNNEGKAIKYDNGGSISDHYEQVNDLFVDKKTFAVTTREDVKVHQGTSFEDALKWAKEQYEKKSGGAVSEATETFVIGDILQNKKHPHIYVTLIAERNSGGSGQLFTAYESDKKGKGVTEGNWVRAVWDWDFKDWDKVGHVSLKEVEKKSDDTTYSYHKSGNKQIDTYLSLFDDRYQFFVKNAPKPLKNLRDKLESDNHHYATATIVSDFFNDPKKNKVTQYKFKKGGKIEKAFIQKVKEIHNQIKEVTLKDGTKIDGKDLMADGGALKNKERVEIVLKHYLIAALWSSTDSDNEDQPFDSEYDIEDFDKKTVDKARKLITKFMMDNEADLKASGLSDDQIGHDLWLTQVGHGAGFWDRGLDKELGDRLSSASKQLGQSAMLFEQDGKVHIDGLNNPDEMAKGGGVSQKFEFPIFVNYDEKKYVALWIITAKDEEAAKDKFVKRRGQNLTFDELLIPVGKDEYKEIDKKPFLNNDEFLDELEIEVDKLIDEGLLEGYKFSKGGKFWINDALAGGKNKGALRRTAMRKGLLRNEKENLSKTDLHKLEKMGGTTAKRAHLAETLSKFDTGGSTSDWTDLSSIVPSGIKMTEENAGQGNAELILTSNGKTIAKFFFNMRGYNQDFSLKNKEGVYYEFGSDKPKATQFSNFKKALREGYVLIKK